MSQLNEQRAKYFGWNPEAEQLYFTADDAAFFRESDARGHAQSLSDKTVELVTRGELTAWEAGQAAEATEAVDEMPGETKEEAAKAEQVPQPKTGKKAEKK